MKGKKINYLLAAGVLLIWGLIFYRIFGALGDNGDQEVFETVPRVKEAYRDYAPVKDTCQLMLNYRDPFGIAPFKDTTLHAPPPKILKNTVQNAPAVNWGAIKYNGYISNKGAARTLSMLSINGKSVTLAEGESSDGVKLIRNAGDSIKIQYHQRIKYITRY